MKAGLAALFMGWVVLICGACADGEGSFSMSFTWEEEPNRELWIWVRVEERNDGAVAGKILGSSGPEAYQGSDGFGMTIDGVTNGENRYVVAEAREGPSTGLPVLYYGISESFVLAPGKHTTIEVPFVLSPPESQLHEGKIALLFNGEEATTIRADDASNATIRMRIAGAVSATIANDASFSAGLKSVPLEDGEAMTCTVEQSDEVTWTDCDYAGWDLTLGTSANEDTVKNIFVKFVDRYGYESKVYKASVLVDTTGPEVLSASLSPEAIRAGGQALLAVTFHEPLSEAPEDNLLTATSGEQALLTLHGPDRVGQTTTYLWVLAAQDEAEGDDQFQFAVSVHDPYGNGGDKQPLVDSDEVPVTLFLDNTLPELVSPDDIIVAPTTFNLQAKELEEVVTFDFAFVEAAPLDANMDATCLGLCPVVTLDNRALGAVERLPVDDDPASNRYAFRFTYAVDPAHFEPVQKEIPIAIEWQDAAGNVAVTTLAQSLYLDFLTPRAIDCILTPSPANSSDIISYSITTSEALLEEPLLDLSPADAGLFPDAPEVTNSGHTYTWQMPAQDLVISSYSVAASLTDLAGNGSQGTVCSQTGQVDTDFPTIESPSLTTIPTVKDNAGEIVVAVGDSDALAVAFTVGEPLALLDGAPVVTIMAGGEAYPLSLESEVEQDLSTDYTYSLVLDKTQHLGAEGLWPIRVTVSDLAGNQTTVEKLAGKLVRIDFTAPVAECAVLPAIDTPHGLGSKVLLQITPLEPLEANFAPQLDEVYLPMLEGPQFALVPGTAYRFAHTVTEADLETSFQVGVSLRDLVGNQTDPSETACMAGKLVGAFDGIGPAVLDLAMTVDDGQPIVGALNAGRTLTVVATVKDAPDDVTVAVGNVELVAAPGTPEPGAEPGTTIWTFAKALSSDDGDGTFVPQVTAFDQAGNVTVWSPEAQSVTFDFTPPAGQCLVSDDYAGAGETVRITVTLSEPLPEPPSAVGTYVGDMAFEYNAGASSPNNTPPTYAFDFAVQKGQANVPWEVAFDALDSAGNHADLCTVAGTVDGQAISLESYSVYARYPDPDVAGEWRTLQGVANAQSDVVAVFELGEIPSSGPTLTIGGKPATQEDLSGTTYTFSLPLDGQGNTGDVVPVVLAVTDEAGNTLQENIGSVTLDYDPPALAGTPYFDRCDGFAPARVAGNKLYVKLPGQSGYGCTFATDPGDCGQEGNPVSGPLSVSFGVTETLREEILTVRVADKDLTIDPCASADTFKVAYYLPDGAEPDEAWQAVTVRLEDLAGNRVDTSLGELWFDGTPPSAPEVAPEGRVVYQRAPWGTADSAKSFKLFGAPESVDPGSHVYLLSGPDPAEADLLAQSQADDQGRLGGGLDGPGIKLPNANLPTVYLQLEDRAGNLSDDDNDASNGLQATQVRDVRWFASMGGKKAGSTTENPHEFYTTNWWRGSRSQDGGDALGAEDDIFGIDGKTFETVGAQLSWRHHEAGDAPGYGKELGGAYDSIRGRLVVFGESQNNVEGTREWDGVRWYELSPTDPEGDGNPIDRSGAGMAFDSWRGHTLLWGGVHGGLSDNVTDDLWAWNGTSWRELIPEDPEGDGNPNQRHVYAFAFDHERGEALLFGGSSCPGGCNDMWTWNGRSWRKIEAEDPEGDGNPMFGSNAAMAYDSKRKRVVLYGPKKSEMMSTTWDKNTWEWNGLSWEKMAGEDEGPPCYSAAEMAYDPDREVTVLFGYCGDLPGTSEVWEWDGTSWTKAVQFDPENDGRPEHRKEHVLAWDSLRRRILVYSGRSEHDCDGGSDNDCFKVWEWDGSSWDCRGPEVEAGYAYLPGRSGHNMTWNPVDKRIDLHGGSNAVIGVAHLQMQWTGNDWLTIPQKPSTPNGSGGLAYAPTIGSGTLALFKQGAGGKTGFYSGGNWSYPLVGDPGGDGSPNPLHNGELVWDAGENHLMLLTGYPMLAASTTWTLQYGINGFPGWDWVNLGSDNALPDASAMHMAYDSDRGTVVMAGEFLGSPDDPTAIYEWTNNKWNAVVPLDPEGDGTPVIQHKFKVDLVWDETRGRVVMAGENIGTEDWEWTGTSWVRLQRGDPDGDGHPPERLYWPLASDAVRGQLITTGGKLGFGDNVYDEGTWVGTWGTQSRPAHVLRVPLAALDLCAPVTYTDVAVNWYAGGEGGDELSTPGAALWVWQGSNWELVGNNQAAPDAPALVTATWNSTHAVDTITVGDQGDIHLAVTPAVPNFAGRSRVATDHVEMTVSYRVPENLSALCD